LSQKHFTTKNSVYRLFVSFWTLKDAAELADEPKV